jgi:SPP1 gp7 family putative phage head morphogenesis protein
MATRIELLRKSGGGIVKSFMDSVFLRNQGGEWITDDVMAFPYKKSDLVYICISTTNRAISQIPIMAYKKINEEEAKPLPMTDPWQKLFAKPNDLMDRNSFVEASVGHLMLDGDVFLIPFPPGVFPPVSIWVVKRKFMGPLRDKQTNRLIGWNYNIKGVNYDGYGGTILTENSIPLGIEEVAHVYFWNPYDNVMGMAPSDAGALNIKIDFKASHYTGNFLDEGAVPGGMLETDKSLTDKQFKRILDQFETRHQGFRKSSRFALLENGLKYTQAGINQKDMEFQKLRELTARRIFQIYGMKEAVISETKNVNYATSREQRKEWWESTNLPMMRMICSALNFILFPKLDIFCQFDYTKIEALREALFDKINTGYKAWQMGFTANEVNNRLDLGFRSKAWRNTWYMPVNLIPVEEHLPPSDTPPSLPPGSAPPIPIPPPPKPPKAIEYLVERSLEDRMKDARGEAIWGSIVRQMVPIEEQFTKKVSRVFFNMRKRTLELLYREKKSIEEVTKDMDDVDKEIYVEEFKELGKVVDPLYKTSLALGFELVATEIGMDIPFDFTDPEALYFLSSKQINIVGIVQTIKEQIRIQLMEGYQGGETLDQVAERIRNVFDIAKSRSRTIARTEVGSATTEGRYLAIDRSGFREKEWFTAMDERVRPTHQAMHGKIVKVGEMWALPSGAYLRHPGDYNGPASEVINCRCVEIVVPGSHWTDQPGVGE